MQSLFSVKDLSQFFYYLLIRFFFKLSPFSLFISYANLRGSYKYFVYRTFRKEVFQNVYQAFGDQKSKKELLKLTKSIIQNVQVWNLCHFFESKLTDAEIERRFPVEGLENLDEVLRKGNGVILLSGHLGTHFITRYLLRKKGYQLKALRFKNLSESSSSIKIRTQLGQFIEEKLKPGSYKEPDKFLFKIEFNSRPLLSFLNDNGVLFTMGDGMQSLTFVEAKFLNNTIPFSLGAMGLAKATGAPVLPVIVSGKRGFKTTIGKPFDLQSSENRQDDIERNTLTFVGCLEEQILKSPHNWRNWVVQDYFARLTEYSTNEENRHGKVLGLRRQ